MILVSEALEPFWYFMSYQGVKMFWFNSLFCVCFSCSYLVFQLCYTEVFEQVAKNAVRGLWARRSSLDLVGAHINVFTGEWTQKVTTYIRL